MIVADDDIFFPGDKAIKKAKIIFKNLQEVYVLPDCLHMPHVKDFPLIQTKLRSWLG